MEDITKPFKNAVITIGNFDGMHLGHQSLFNEVMKKADNIGGTSVAMTFEPHPIRVLKTNGHPPLITLYEQKIELIENSGIDVLICVPFTPEFADITARSFIRDIIINRIGARAIVVGRDYTFGKKREGNLEMLKNLASELDFEVIIPDWIKLANALPDRISSTGIRKFVMAGKVAEARKLLGRFYQIRGTVVKGRNRGGKLLGFPTANINLHDELCPKIGVYAVTVQFNGERLKGVANIGYSPTFDDHILTVEVHILDFDQELYRKKIRVNFIQRIRDEIKFANIAELSEQIKKDIIKTRNLL
ncbi:MAG: bifunctional riboflavin kinase/FAD synthetase [Deltaproteobacteria bacterium]|nr:bifunctional riboflavin kinase/FAD synthetase [Deltaproteobacteria bacterium]